MSHILNKTFEKIFVITLEDSFRIPRMNERLEGIDFEYFYGVNGATLDKTPYIEMGSKQTRGQLGCTLSHFNLYHKILEEGYENVLIRKIGVYFI
jgi:GR25 family glycosyltransferase involved in LPS biosynthesis